MSADPRRLRFSKMHGAGNDFVIIDCRAPGAAARVDAALVARLGDRHRGIGFDQLLTVEPAEDGSVACRIFNADGSAARQCGNGVRCLAAWLLRDGTVRLPFVLHSPAGAVAVSRDGDGLLAVDLQVPEIDPASHAVHVDGRDWPFAAVSMGNPHAVIEVDDVAGAPVAQVGAALQRDARFPDSCNVGFVQVLDRHHVRLRVFERGVGETLACGSGACAAAAVLLQRGRVDAPVDLQLPGGILRVDWHDPAAPARLAGPTEFVFEGECTA